MKKILIIVFIIFIALQDGYTQTGIGGSAGMNYYGIASSDPSASQFKAGWGYEVFFRHDLFKIGPSNMISARYTYRHHQNSIELPFVLDTRFIFKYLTIDFIMDVYKTEKFSVYPGLGLSLVTINAEKDWYQYTDSPLVPEIILGGEWRFADYYCLFTEISLQHGALKDVLGEDIPISGVRFILGFTMFISE